jgi:hypothetical protein
MSQWESRVREHLVWSTLDSIGPMIDSCLSNEGLDPESIAGLERIRMAITAVGRRLAATDVQLITPSQLNSLNNPLERAYSELNAYQTSKVFGHIVNANTYIDECLNFIGQIAGPITSEDLSVLSSSASNFRSTINRYLKELTNKINEIQEIESNNRTEANLIAAALQSEKNLISNLISDLQTQFTASQNQRSSEFTTTINDATTKISAELDTLRTEISKLQNDQVAQLNNIVAEYKTQFEETNKSISDDVEDLKADYKNNLHEHEVNFVQAAQLMLDKVQGQKERVEKLVGIIGNIGVSSGFLKVANRARWAGTWWRFVTALSLAGLIYVSYSVAFPDSSKTPVSVSINLADIDNPNTTSSPAKTEAALVKSTEKDHSEDHIKFVQGFLAKLFLSITFGIFAAYSATQARRFFDLEQKNRQKALELEALGPFIEPLEKADQDTFRIKVGDRSFGLPDDSTKDTNDSDPTSVLSIIKDNSFVDGCTKIIKAIKG